MVSEEDERDRLTRRLTFYAVLCGGLIALGTAYVSIGGTLILSTVPQMLDAIHEAQTANLNQTSVVNELNDKFKLVSWEANNSIFFIISGSMSIVLGVICAIIRIYRSPRQNHAHPQVNDLNVSITSESSQTYEYTGNKYYATRTRKAYHPPDKMFPNETSKSDDIQKQEPKKQRGMLPKGF